jgi:hypothetical protein
LKGARASRRGGTRPRLPSFTGSTCGNTCRTCRRRASMPGGTHTGNAANSRLEGMLSSRSATRKVTDRLRLCRHRRPWLRRRNSDPRRASMENPHWLLRSLTDVLVGLFRNSFALSDRSSSMHCRSVVPLPRASSRRSRVSTETLRPSCSSRLSDAVDRTAEPGHSNTSCLTHRSIVAKRGWNNLGVGYK